MRRSLDACRPRDRAARTRAAAAVFCNRLAAPAPALERGEDAGTKRSSTSVTMTLSQAIGIVATARAKNCAGVVPPETASNACAALGDRLASGDRRRVRPAPPPVRSRAAKSCQSVAAPAMRQSLSCQVRPSRSISAIDADGPQVPAV